MNKDYANCLSMAINMRRELGMPERC